MAYDLKGRVVFLTGASSGIGLAAARAYAQAGARVVAVARRKDRLVALEKELSQEGLECLPLACDVKSDSSVQEAVEKAVQRFSRLDVLINNAGVGLYGPVADLSVEQLHENFQTNVYGALRCIRACLPHIRRQGQGQILNVSSVLGHRALPNMGGYCASKFALNALTESLRIELAAEGLDVILISPGITTTEFRESAMLTPTARRERRVALKAMTPEEVAQAMVKASRRQQREVVLTLAGKAMVRVNAVAPGLLDRVARRMVQSEG